MTKTILILQIASTLVLVGVIWIIQLVQYPFFSEVREDNFPKYHAAYTFWITPIVALAMIVEFLSSIFIVFYAPENIDAKLIYFGLLLTIVVWLSTFSIQVPMHNKLALGFDAQAHKKLVNSNWIRTIAWSMRGALVLYFAWQTIRV